MNLYALDGRSTEMSNKVIIFVCKNTPTGKPVPCFYHEYNENHPSLIDGTLTKMQTKKSKECENPQPEGQRRKTKQNTFFLFVVQWDLEPMTIGNYHTSKLREAEHWVVRVIPAQERHSSHSSSSAHQQHTRSRACWANAIRLYRLRPWLLDEQSSCCMALSDTETPKGH